MSDQSRWNKLDCGFAGDLGNPFPAICCSCLKPTPSKYRMVRRRFRKRFGPRFAVPLCSSCQQSLDRKRNIVGAVILVLVILAGVGAYLAPNNAKHRVSAVIYSIGCVSLVGMVVSQFLIEPFQLWGSTIRFRNNEFTQRWKETWGKPVDFLLPQEWQKRE